MFYAARLMEHDHVIYSDTSIEMLAFFFFFLFSSFLSHSSDVEEGGETVFPSAKINSSSLPWYNELSDCGKKALSVKPKMGDALLFWSMKPDAIPDPMSLHGSL